MSEKKIIKMRDDMNSEFLAIDLDSVVLPKDVIQVNRDEKPVGYTIGASSANKFDLVEEMINNRDCPLDDLPPDMREMIVSLRGATDQVQEKSTSVHK